MIISKKYIYILVTIFVFLFSISKADNKSDEIKCANNLLSQSSKNINLDIKERMLLLNRALTIFSDLNDKKGLGDTYNAISNQYLYKEQTDTALALSFKALKYGNELNDSSIKSSAYLKLGILYYQLRNYKASVKYSKESIRFGDPLNIASATANIGIVYSETNRLDSAFYFIYKANSIFISIGDSNKNALMNVAITYMNMGSIDIERGELIKAKKWFNKSLIISYKIKDYNNIILNYLNFGDIFMIEKKYDLSEQMIRRARSIADSVKLYNLYNLTGLALSELYYENNNYKDSRDLLWTYINNKDSVQGLNIENKIANLQMKYEVENKNIQIEILEKDKKLNNYRIYLTALIMLFIASVIIFYINKRRLKIRERMASAIKVKDITLNKLSKAKNEIEYYTKMIQENNDRIECFEQELLNSNSKDSEELNNKLEKLRGMKILKDEDWLHYKDLFKDVFSDFYHKVTQIQNLTEGDKRQILLIKLSYTNKMSADVLGISIEGVKRAKQRLAKKMNLENAGKLEEYFNKI